MRETLDGEDVQAVHAVVEFHIETGEQPVGHADAGIVDEEFQSRLRGYSVFDGAKIGFDGEIGRKSLGVAQLSRQLLQALPAPRDQQEAAAFQGQPAGEDFAYSAGSARDQRSGFGFIHVFISTGRRPQSRYRQFQGFAPPVFRGFLITVKLKRSL
jgi:hypothetical protein